MSRKRRVLSPELQAALEPLLGAIESLSERIYEYNQQIEKIATNSYPRVARLEQVKGVGTLIALTLEDAQRFRKSRDVVNERWRNSSPTTLSRLSST